MRPKSLGEYAGQDHIMGEGKPLRKAIESGNVPSFILWGPPGVGKTTIGHLIALTLKRPFIALSAINSGVADIREAIKKAESQRFFDSPNPILFIDEIHRFSKSQQDSLLGAVEKGTVTLIGATTENPSFEINGALLSRCQLYTLQHHTEESLRAIVDRAVSEDVVLKKRDIKVEEYEALIMNSGGDARRLLNVLELIISQHYDHEAVIITNELVEKLITEHPGLYDKTGEMHYDVVSAFIKSMRGSDPNATLYYLAMMIESGEDPLFICRRMIILSAEDVGLANPNALLMANNCYQAVHQIGMPEGRIVMSQCAVYLASSPKSNSTYTAIDDAIRLIRENPNLPIPKHLRNAPTKMMKDLDYCKDYKYAHNSASGFVKDDFLPKKISKTSIYKAKHIGAEAKIAEYLKEIWKGHYDF
jgi:putative ATPase